MGTKLSMPALLAALALGGCSVGPDYAPPSLFSPASWFGSDTRTPGALEASMPTVEPVDPEWWRSFNDPTLTGLVHRAAAGNLDVQAATARLAQSRAQRGITGADQYPQVNGNASYTREKPSSKGAISAFGGGAAGGASGGSGATDANGLGGRQGGFPSTGGIPAFDLFQGGFDASWELDLWGRVRRAVESADASLQASREARRASLLSTIAEVARDYMQLRGTQDTLRITRSNLVSAQESARLTQERARGGLATDLDVANAQAQVDSTAAAIPQLEQQEAQGINAISLLLGRPPGTLQSELSEARGVPRVPPRVPAGLPSELARRRPDIRQAEAQLHAATATIGVAEADFYPRVTLSGSFALQATQLKDLGLPARTFGFGPSLTVPIFDGRRIRRTVELRTAQQQEAMLNYQKAVLQAFTDVDNALVAYAAEQRRNVRLAAQVGQSRRALGLAQSRYRQGVSDFLEVLTAQRTVLQAEQQLADSTATVSANLVALYKALGGGWEGTYPEGVAVGVP
ncbi:MAG TPA: efflux transporter outer membrane subunit [Acetobacteraceae bacterium]